MRHSNLFTNVSKISRLENISYEILIFLRAHISSHVSDFPVASSYPWGKLQNFSFSDICKEIIILICLWGKLQNLSYSNFFKQVIISFCLAGMAFYDISTYLIINRKRRNWRGLVRGIRFVAPTYLISNLWFSRDALEIAKFFLFDFFFSIKLICNFEI